MPHRGLQGLGKGDRIIVRLLRKSVSRKNSQVRILAMSPMFGRTILERMASSTSGLY